MERAWKPSVEISPNCPRCGSSNTKFCYYNNYSLTQPRYFCKGCRRYWTKGGSLRNVPVGGGCRKNRRGNKSLRDVVPNSINKSNYGSSDGRAKDVDGSGFLSDQSTGGSHIDLALVYANFLNSDSSKKTVDSGGEIPDLPVDFDPALALPNMDLDSGAQLSDGSNQLGCFGELESVLDHPDKTGVHRQVITGYDNFGLPPFPGEEVGSHLLHHHHHHHDHQECLWSNSASSSMVHHHGNVHAHALVQSSSSTSQLLGIEPDQCQEPNLVSWSPFDLSTFDNFSRP